MKNSERNLEVIRNFIDYFTSDNTERERMYGVAEGYTKEDHVDGEGNPEDDKVDLKVEHLDFLWDRDYQGHATIQLKINGQRFESIGVFNPESLTSLGFKK